MKARVVPWFLWSILTPGSFWGHDPNTIHAVVIKEFPSQTACEKALTAYRVEVEKAYPIPRDKDGNMVSGLVTWTTVDLRCSPVNPKP